MRRAPATERGPRALSAHYEINGRDLKSGKLDAARAAEGGGGRRGDQSRRSARAYWRGGANHRAARYYLSIRTLFSSFLLGSPFNRQRKWNERARKLHTRW